MKVHEKPLFQKELVPF